MKFTSPLPEQSCRAILHEQVQRRSWLLRLRLFCRPTSHVVGVVEEDKVELASSINLFSKRFVGVLRAAPEGSLLEGHWEYPFGFRLFGDEQFDEEEIFGFLAEHAQFKRYDGFKDHRE